MSAIRQVDHAFIETSDARTFADSTEREEWPAWIAQAVDNNVPE